MEKYNIPSLKNSLFHFNEWFERVFPLYSRQFATAINKTKVSNYLKYQFRQHFITHLKELLPTSHEFAEPHNLQERRYETFKQVNYHILTCKDDKCLYLQPVETPKGKEKEKDTNPKTITEIQLQHDTSTLTKHIFDESYQRYPKQDNESWNEPYLDPSVFYIKGKYEATFQKQIPTTILDELATKAEDYTCSANVVKTNPKRRGFYFYQYLSIYQNTAAQNHNIDKMDKQQAIDSLTTKLIDTNFLARVITYFDCTRGNSPNYSEIVKFYKEKALPEAETILSNKFNTKFEIPTSIEESLFLKKEEETPFH